MTHVEFPGLGLAFDVNPVAFTIGNFEFRWYGILIALGFILAFLYALKICKRYQVNQDHLIDCIIAGLVLGIIGARLYYVIFYPGDMYWKDPIKILYINEGGLGIYGGIIGGLLGGIIMAKIHKMKIPGILDIAVQGFLIGQGIGRWGNFINQEAFGVNTNLPWGMYSAKTESYLSSQQASLEAAGISVDPTMPVHPTFLYESLWCLLGVLVLYWFSKKFQKYHGQVFLLYLIWYGVERFVVEGLRTDSLMIGNFRVSQIVAIVSALVGVVLLIVFRNKGKVEEEYVPVYAKPEELDGAEADEQVDSLESETASDDETTEGIMEKKDGEEPEKDETSEDESGLEEATADGDDDDVKAGASASDDPDEKMEDGAEEPAEEDSQDAEMSEGDTETEDLKTEDMPEEK